jgi:DNA modification methylase
MSQIVINGNNIDILKTYPDNYFDAVVTDPPYGLGKEPNAAELMKDWVEHGYHEVSGSGFMGKEWDAFVPQPVFWKEVFRVLKHGGHVLSFFGTRTYDWGVMSMRFAGFEVRDCIQWLYGSGFPKSHNISKALDKMEGAERQIIGEYNAHRDNSIRKKITYKGIASEGKGGLAGKKCGGMTSITAPSTEDAKQWDGWGSALKPAHEDLVLARKPFQFSSDFVYLYENIVYNLKVQLCQSKLFVKDAKEIFTLSQKELQGEGLDFAQWSVEKTFNTKVDLSVLMDMLQLELKEDNTTLNIVLSWLNTLVELWSVANIYTTETESSTITELRILNSLEWESIFQNITLLKDKKIGGLSVNVLTAESLFSVLNLKLNDILIHSAKESAILKVEEKGFVPNSEQIVLARKPLEKGLSIAENILKWGVGGINIDATRISTENKKEYENNCNRTNVKSHWGNSNFGSIVKANNQGRFPANIILQHHPECECKGTKKIKPSNGSGKASEKGGGFSKGMFGDGTSDNIGGGFTDAEGKEEVENWDCHEDCPIRILDEQSGVTKSPSETKKKNSANGETKNCYGKYSSENRIINGHADSGGASRFFKHCNYSEQDFVRFQYQAKASKSERNKGLEGFDTKQTTGGGGTYNEEAGAKYGSIKAEGKNFHPTVKPIKLMQYLVKMITPPNGIVLDPFCGSGTTGIACKLEGFQFVGMEQDPEYFKIAEGRIKNYKEEKEKTPKNKPKEDKQPINTQTTLF